MKTNMLGFTSLCLLLCWIIPVDSMKRNNNFIKEEPGSIPLSMCEESVDDRYSYCSEDMSKQIDEKYFKNEMNKESFRKAWNAAETCTKRSLPPKDKLTKNHIQAICVYTAGAGNLYREFNEAVRTGRKNYASSFPFHSLHFWLTRAVQILNNNHDCYTTYRRTNTQFTGKVNQEIRIGNFASSSLSSNLSRFGKVTCFQIKTCEGAYLKKYPVLEDHEQEVLIPPYEKFKITQKCETEECKSAVNLSDCEIVYVLKSTGVLSNLDCQLAKRIIV